MSKVAPTSYSTIGGQTQPPPTQFPITPLSQQNAHLHCQPLHPQQVQLLSGPQSSVSSVPSLITPAGAANQDTVFCSCSSSSCSSSSCSTSALPPSAKLHPKSSTSTLPLGQQWKDGYRCTSCTGSTLVASSCVEVYKYCSVCICVHLLHFLIHILCVFLHRQVFYPT